MEVQENIREKSLKEERGEGEKGCSEIGWTADRLWRIVFSLFALYLLTKGVFATMNTAKGPVITNVRGKKPTFFLPILPLSLCFCPFHLMLVLSCFLSLSASLSVCSCLLTRETKSGSEGKLMKTGICGNREGDGEGGGVERWGPSGDESNRSRMIMTSEPLLSTALSLHSHSVTGRACMCCNV